MSEHYSWHRTIVLVRAIRSNMALAFDLGLNGCGTHLTAAHHNAHQSAYAKEPPMRWTLDNEPVRLTQLVLERNMTKEEVEHLLSMQPGDDITLKRDNPTWNEILRRVE